MRKQFYINVTASLFGSKASCESLKVSKDWQVLSSKDVEVSERMDGIDHCLTLASKISVVSESIDEVKQLFDPRISEMDLAPPLTKRFAGINRKRFPKIEYTFGEVEAIPDRKVHLTDPKIDLIMASAMRKHPKANSLARLIIMADWSEWNNPSDPRIVTGFTIDALYCGGEWILPPSKIRDKGYIVQISNNPDYKIIGEARYLDR